MWLVNGRATRKQLNNAIDYVEKALQWLVDDGLAKRIKVDGILKQKGIEMLLTIYTASGNIDTKTLELWKFTEDF